LLFAGAEEVLRTIERQRARFEVAILEVSRIDEINDSARRMLAGMRATLSAVGKEGYLVDPDGEVVRTAANRTTTRSSSAASMTPSSPRSVGSLSRAVRPG
jgi:glutaminase